MAVNEKIQTGRKFRKLIDEDSRLWLRISFWTKASDVEFDDNETAETKFADMSSRINDLATSFRDGVNKIFNCLKGLGFTPSTNSPDGICQAVQKIHDTRYTNGYNAGRLQGQEDVKANPGGFGVFTSPKKFSLFEQNFTDSYTCPTAGTYHVQVRFLWNNNQGHNACGNLVRLHVNGTTHTFLHYRFSDTSFKHEGENATNGQIISANLPAGATISLEVQTGDSSYSRTQAAWTIW